MLDLGGAMRRFRNGSDMIGGGDRDLVLDHCGFVCVSLGGSGCDLETLSCYRWV